jgi:hypothetical protein
MAPEVVPLLPAKTVRRGNSVVAHLPSMPEALGSIPGALGKKNKTVILPKPVISE